MDDGEIALVENKEGKNRWMRGNHSREGGKKDKQKKNWLSRFERTRQETSLGEVHPRTTRLKSQVAIPQF